VTLQPVTRCIAQAVLDGGPITREFEKGSLHDRIPQAMGLPSRHRLWRGRRFADRLARCAPRL